jgi:hypothetical protein
MTDDNEKDREIADLKSQVAELKAAMIILQRRVDPPPRPPEAARLEGHSPSTYRLIDKMSVPKNVFDKLVETVPTELVRQVMEDRKR